MSVSHLALRSLSFRGGDAQATEAEPDVSILGVTCRKSHHFCPACLEDQRFSKTQVEATFKRRPTDQRCGIRGCLDRQDSGCELVHRFVDAFLGVGNPSVECRLSETVGEPVGLCRRAGSQNCQTRQ